jgi:hypothetical protein
MKALSSPMVVTQYAQRDLLRIIFSVFRAEGNLVISLDNKNPTQLLLAAIRASGIEFRPSDSFRDNDEFSLATLEADKVCSIRFSFVLADWLDSLAKCAA